MVAAVRGLVLELDRLVTVEAQTDLELLLEEGSHDERRLADDAAVEETARPVLDFG